MLKVLLSPYQRLARVAQLVFLFKPTVDIGVLRVTR